MLSVFGRQADASSPQLLTNDKYLPGALTVARALRDGGTTRKLAVLVTLPTVSNDTIDALKVNIWSLGPSYSTLPNPKEMHLLT